MRHFIVLFLALLVLGSQAALAAPRPKTCLVLAGGGALGIAHVGVIKILEQEHVPVDCIVGTSMGAIVGGLYASGYSAAELEGLVRDSDWASLFTERAPREDRRFQDKKDDYTFLIPYRLGIDENGQISLPRGMIRGDRIDVSFLLFALRSGYIHDFDHLPIQFRAMASNLETGNPVEIGRGNLAQAMRASMSVPAVFTPAPYPLADLTGPENPHLWTSLAQKPLPRVYLVDGGVANNLPIDVARTLGAERVIAVHLPTILKTNAELGNAFSIAGQMISVMIKQNEDRQLATLGPQDLLIQPDVSAFSAISFDQADAIIPKGIIAAEAKREELKRFAVKPQEFAAIRARQYRPEPEPVRIGQIDLHNETPLDDGVIKSYLSLKPGEKLTIKDLQRNVTRLYGTGQFESVTVDLTPSASGDSAAVKIHTVPSKDVSGAEPAEAAVEIAAAVPTANLSAPAPAPISSGVPPIQDLQMTMTSSNQERENLRFGLSLSDDFDGESNYNLAVRYTRRAINPLGGQVDVQVQVGENNLLFSEWYQPLEAKGDWFIAPRMQYASFNASPIDSSSGVQESEYQVRLAEGGIDMGYNLGFDTQMRIGYRGGVGDTKLDIGNPVDFPDDSFDLSYLQGVVAYDSLDDVNFPTKGERLLIIGTHSQTGFGASNDYDQARINAAISRSWERNSFLLISDAALNVKDDDMVPIQSRYLAGGFLNLSGYQQNALLTNNYWINKILAYRRISSDGWLVSLPVHLGASFEMGSLESKYSEISLDPGDQIFAGSTFLGVDTFVGPLYLAYGQAEGGQRSLYFFLGRTF